MTSEKRTDAQVVGAELYLLPIAVRTPLKFGAETLTTVTCARARLTIAGRDGRTASGWGETPLSAAWAWPAPLSYANRDRDMAAFAAQLAQAWAQWTATGHPIEIGLDFQQQRLPHLLDEFNASRLPAAPMPHLAALVCCSPFDVALHDAYGKLHDAKTYDTYNPRFMNRDLSQLLQSDDEVDFSGKYIADFLAAKPANKLTAWHLAGALDPLEAHDPRPADPRDGYPLLLADWIERDGLRAVKVKLRGNDAAWDFERLVRVGRIGSERGVVALCADFNCMVDEPAYVLSLLDRLHDEAPAVLEMILYVEQPFPYDVEAHPIDVRAVAARKPLLMDESADSWKHVRLGRSLGWNGVALKTCKTQTGALLSLCWAKAHGMHLMVQDLTNPMLAQIPHVLLAAHAETMLGVETNAVQFYPAASAPESQIHPGLYERRAGSIDLTTLDGPGFGYRIDEIPRTLPPPIAQYGSMSG